MKARITIKDIKMKTTKRKKEKDNNNNNNNNKKTETGPDSNLARDSNLTRART